MAAALGDRWVLMVTEVLGDAEGLREAEEEPEGELEARGEDVASPAEKGGRRQRRRGRRAISKHGRRDTEGNDLRCSKERLETGAYKLQGADSLCAGGVIQRETVWRALTAPGGRRE